jgi:hypothetical protein
MEDKLAEQEQVANALAITAFKTASLHHCITAPLHHCTTAPLHHCTTATLSVSFNNLTGFFQPTISLPNHCNPNVHPTNSSTNDPLHRIIHQTIR